MTRFLAHLLILTSLTGSAQVFAPIDPEDVLIVRDQWGVPHIHGRTDAHAAYGLAWANAEDAFENMQQLLLIGKGLMGRVEGRSGAEADFFRHAIGARAIAEERWRQLPDDFLRYLDGYVQGANRYAETHPSEVLHPDLVPVTIPDVLTSYVVTLSFMTGASGALERIYGGDYDEDSLMLGSNAYAVNAQLSNNGETWLCINPHFQMDGPLSFYEAHVSSDEGLNFTGALFHGGTSVFMGNNEHLGWGMTWNSFDGGDVYRLEMHPRKRRTYRYDGEWLTLEKRLVWLKVKVGKLVVPVPKRTYWSELGPVLKSPEGMFYAFRYPAFMDVTAPLQWYRMNKATNLEEFKDALRIQGIPLFNVVYADAEGNIFYIYHGQIPERPAGVSGEGVLAGNSSELVWERIVPIDDLPQELNPDCGFVYNTNNTPLEATCIASGDTLMPWMCTRPGNNNRAERFLELMEDRSSLTYEEFKNVKWDKTMPRSGTFYDDLAGLRALDPAAYPDIADMIRGIQAWDQVADTLSIGATLNMVTVDHVFKAKGYGDANFVNGIDVSEAEWVTAIREAQDHLMEHFGTIEVPLGEILVARRGDRQVTPQGYPDAMAAQYGEKADDGRYPLIYGDTYTHFVRWSPEGEVLEVETMVPFGNSTHPESAHYFDQAELFRAQETKPMPMHVPHALDDAERVYHPW